MSEVSYKLNFLRRQSSLTSPTVQYEFLFSRCHSNIETVITGMSKKGRFTDFVVLGQYRVVSGTKVLSFPFEQSRRCHRFYFDIWKLKSITSHYLCPGSTSVLWKVGLMFWVKTFSNYTPSSWSWPQACKFKHCYWDGNCLIFWSLFSKP